MTRKTWTIIAVIVALGLVGYAAHTFNLLGLAREVHGG